MHTKISGSSAAIKFIVKLKLNFTVYLFEKIACCLILLEKTGFNFLHGYEII